MKKILFTAALSLSVLANLAAQTAVNDKMTIYQLPNAKLHLYQSGDAMGDVSFIVEGDKKLIILEQPLFWNDIEEFNSYIEELDKPIERVVANYHSLGLANYKPSLVSMPHKMIEFNKGAMAEGMITKFKNAFGDAADFRPYTRAKGFDVPSTQSWADVDLQFSAPADSHFPGANILIDGKVYYRHFAPSISHFNPMELNSTQSVDNLLEELKEIAQSGAEYIIGSHGTPASQKEVAFQIEYLERVKELMKSCSNSDSFGQQLILSYPSLTGAENVKAISKTLYPNEITNAETEALRGRVQEYFRMVSNLDTQIAQGLWAERDNVSIITPRGHFVGRESIMNDFLIKSFSTMQSRHLHSLNEVINIYGQSANVQLYWIFDTIDAQGEKHQTRGRESLIFAKIDGQWRLTHVHYSRMPQ